MEEVLQFFKDINVTEIYQTIISFEESITWFVSLGYVMIVSILFTLCWTALAKVTIFKKTLSKYDSIINSGASEIEIKAAKNSKDKLLSAFGYISSIIIYAGFYILFDCIQSGIWSVEVFSKYATDVTFYSVTIPTGAATVLFVVKGLYTMIHKFIGRIKDKKEVKEIAKETAKDLETLRKDTIAQAQARESSVKTLSNKGIGSTSIKAVKTTKK